MSKVYEDRTPTQNLRNLHLTTTSREKWIINSYSHSVGQVLGNKRRKLTLTLSNLKSNPVKSEGKEYNIGTLKQEIDSLKQIVAQQNRVLQHLGAILQTPSRQMTTKPSDIPILELHQLQGLNATT